MSDDHGMTEPKTRRTRSGRILTDEEIEQQAAKVAETDYDVEELKTRCRRGRPLMGSAPARCGPSRESIPSCEQQSRPAPKGSMPR